MEQITVYISPFHKTLKFNAKGKYYDMSNEIPESIWNIGDRKFPLNPIKDWEMRKEARKIFIKYFRENVDKDLNEDEVIF
jgi:hypothetical protein